MSIDYEENKIPFGTSVSSMKDTRSWNCPPPLVSLACRCQLGCFVIGSKRRTQMEWASAAGQLTRRRHLRRNRWSWRTSDCRETTNRSRHSSPESKHRPWCTSTDWSDRRTREIPRSSCSARLIRERNSLRWCPNRSEEWWWQSKSRQRRASESS